MSYIEIKDLVKEYIQGEERIYAIDHLSLGIEEGEFLVVLGPSGSGKSTLLHILGGLDNPTSGHIMVNGSEITSLSDTNLAIYRRKTVGYVFQSFNLLPTLSVMENIELPVIMDGGNIEHDYLQKLMDSLEIGNLQSRLPSQISGGQMQRVAIARAMANHPSLILADEPTGNLDTEASAKVLTLLTETCRTYGKTLIMITHNEEIARSADRVVYIRNGKIVEGKK